MERLTCKRHDSDGYTVSCLSACRGGDCWDCVEFEKIINRLAAYEDTGLTPEQCENAKSIIESVFTDDTSKAEHIRDLLKADKEGRVVVLPEVRYCERYGWQNITWDSKYGICAGSHNTREEAEEALRRAKNG